MTAPRKKPHLRRIGALCRHHGDGIQRDTAMTFLTDITFFDFAMTALSIGAIDRFVLPYLPESAVGPDGWLLRG